MTKVPVPITFNSFENITDAVVQDILSSLIPGSGTLVTALREYKQGKINQAFELFLEELRKGRVDLNDHEREQFIPVAYRFFKAAEEGTINRNLHLLAKLIKKQIDENELSYEKYITLDNAIKDLSLEELIVLSEICKQIGSDDTHSFSHAPGYRTITIENYRL